MAASSAISAATKSSSTCSTRARRTAPSPAAALPTTRIRSIRSAINGANGTTFYFRVDWFTPDGLRTWGDGRTIIIGTKGYIEIRKYVDVGTERDGGNHVFLVNDQGEQYINATGLTGYPFFGDLILDSLNRTENAMTQAHAFKAAELCLIAQKQAEMVYQAK